MGKIYLDKNVFDAANERLTYIFTHFENVYFSFSGGKDSSVMVQLANRVAKQMGRTFDVLYIDLEGNYKATRKHIQEIKQLSQIRDFYWVCLPIKLRNSISQFQTHWVCWDKMLKHLWIRPRPADSINEENYLKKYNWDWFVPQMQFEDFVIEFAKWYQQEKQGQVACGVGIRANESLNRFLTIVSDSKGKYQDRVWTTLVKVPEELPIYNFYPIYDWETSDIWTVVARYDFMYNYVYELMYKNGLSIHESRLCQPYGDDQRKGLEQFKSIEAETWGKVLMRVQGANFGSLYSRGEMLSFRTLNKPAHMSWQEYTVFLLETIGTVNFDLMEHYAEKIRKFINWYERKGVFEIKDVCDSKLETKRMVPSWRRIAKMILKNDYYGKTLSFNQTKKDDEKLEVILENWRNYYGQY
ncbi:DUF3440 domain-containing protein [Culicoidibacter larvae]|uniref:DUF3440 domain-containing protein n=1 Tax=Culicoidibacter larvae TaxID=2579976 RepID=A0A5R8QF65_9FIRM|nr:DUF3440 domain-containing protein [Culicoidibacter larvae]TLG76681.1 DUF3440 domain-containing protein [Culicoidibacter larvae]